MSENLDDYDYDVTPDDVEDRQSFVGRFFIIRECYWSEQGMWPEGYAGVVKAPVGRDHHLIQACKVGFKQHIVPTGFFIEGRALIFDTFDELKEAKDRFIQKRVRA
jgi:hypothetical protein